jgi:hypothetical protein
MAAKQRYSKQELLELFWNVSYACHHRPGCGPTTVEIVLSGLATVLRHTDKDGLLYKRAHALQQQIINAR